MLNGLFLSKPVTSVKTFDGKSVRVHRCQTDGALVFETQESLRLHAGHFIKQPVCLKLHERILLWLKILS